MRGGLGEGRMSNGSIERRTTINVPARPVSGNSSPKSPSSPLTRSASYIQLSPEEPQKFPTRTDSLRRSFSQNVLAKTPSNIQRRSSLPDEPNGSPDSTGIDSKRNSTYSVTTLHDASPHFSLGDDDAASNPVHIPVPEQPKEIVANAPVEGPVLKEAGTKKVPERGQARRSVSGTISNFARRRSWIGTPRSPSPSPKKRHSGIGWEATSKVEATHSIPRPVFQQDPYSDPCQWRKSKQ